jgi:hypothetical protein
MQSNMPADDLISAKHLANEMGISYTTLQSKIGRSEFSKFLFFTSGRKCNVRKKDKCDFCNTFYKIFPKLISKSLQ